VVSRRGGAGRRFWPRQTREVMGQMRAGLRHSAVLVSILAAYDKRWQLHFRTGVVARRVGCVSLPAVGRESLSVCAVGMTIFRHNCPTYIMQVT